jgi:DnaJ-domain-containing protein 1
MCKTIEAIRGIERWAASDMIERAFTGFMALPGGSSDDWWSVLKIEKTATLEEIKQARNKLARIYHPDVGENPSHEMMGKINTAFERATAERG